MARERSRAVDFQYPGCHQRFANINNTGTVTIRRQETMHDEVTPSFASLRRRGVPLPVNEMTQTKSGITDLPSFPLTYYRPYDGTEYSMYGLPTSYFVARAVDGVYVVNSSWPFFEAGTPKQIDHNVLLQHALAKAKTAAWDAGTFAAELHKVDHMISNAKRNFLRRFDWVLHRLKRKRSSNMDPLRTFGEYWLEYRYGWRILAKDMQDISHAMANLNRKVNQYARYTAFKEERETKVTVYTPSNFSFRYSSSAGGSMPFIRPLVSRTDTYIRRVRAGVGVERYFGDKPFIDPLVTLSEITPYMLVANWFVNVKDVIAAWSPFVASSPRWSFVTEEVERRVECHTTFEPDYTSGPNAVTIPPNPGWYYAAYGLFRTRSPVEPTFRLQLRLNFRPTNAVDAAAMVLNRVRLLQGLRWR